MPGSPVIIGPFTQGLNTYNDPTSVSDNECVELYNMDIDLDGALVNRPPIAAMPSAPGNGSTILGTYVTTGGVTYYVIIDTANNLKVFDISSGAALYTISTNIACQAVVQYQNKLWVIATPNSANPGGSWDSVSGFTAIPTMARGVTGTIYKERLFIGSGSQSSTPSRINFSAAANLSSWNAGVDFFDANNGDGQSIVKLYTYSGRIVIFKTNSTYVFGYDSQPTKGQTEIVSTTIGIANSDSFAEFENIMYVIYNNYLYAIQNFNWDQVNVKVPFIKFTFKVRTNTNDSALSVVGNRLICRYYDNFYVYGLKTRAFSIWRFDKADLAPSRFFSYPVLDTTSNATMYVAGNYDTAKNQWYKLLDTPVSSLSESMDLLLTTKTYDYKVAYTYKRLFWWGADLMAKTQVSYRVQPTVFNVPVKWSQISNGVTKWSQLKTWGRPIDVSIDVTDSSISANASGVRTFVKLLKALRFRQISFKVSTTVDGTTFTSPFKIFSLTASTASKELVNRKIN